MATRDARLYVTHDVAKVRPYDAHLDVICILERDGSVRELTETADAPTADALAARRERAYVSLPKAVAP